jgi:hypothetical protein
MISGIMVQMIRMNERTVVGGRLGAGTRLSAGIPSWKTPNMQNM